jgi:hypothetical protein
VRIQPTEIDDVLHNPWMGWGLFATKVSQQGRQYTIEKSTQGFGDDAPLFDWIMLDWMWADLEPEEGAYTWDELDHVIDYWAARGKQINLRVWVTEDPGWDGKAGAPEVCPRWVWAAGARYHEYMGEGGVMVKEPDYADPSYQEIYLPKLQNFLEALADRYDKPGNPFNFLGCMGYGQWGEWHTMWSNYFWPSKQVKHDVLARVVNMHADAFEHVDWAISYCFDTFNIGTPQPPTRDDWRAFRRRIALDDPEDFKYRQALDVALGRGFLLGRHGFIDGLAYVDRVIMEQEWRRRALYAEANWSYRSVRQHGTHGTLDENVDVMLHWHSNYGHFYMDCESYREITPEDAASFERGLKSGGLGYRLVLTEASWPDELRPGTLLLLRQKWANRNVGRCYRRHPLRLYLTDTEGHDRYTEIDYSFDETGWVRGETYDAISVFHLPADLPEGEYDLWIALVDMDGKPQIRLAIAGDDGDKRSKLGKLHIGGPSTAGHAISEAF